jgi:DNA-directed RNA polymerase subunit RPC12/RpoP
VRPSTKHSLKDASPELAKQWHPTKNGTLTPDKVTPATYKKVWWKCEKGHEWEALIVVRNYRGCPFCVGRKVTKEYNLAVLHPYIASQWHPTKNGTLTPDKVTPGASKKVWWKCEQGHEWMAVVGNRRNSTGCPYCRRPYISEDYNLEVINPQLAKQWHSTKNGDLRPDKLTPGSGKKVWWTCEKGHEWRASILNRSRGSGCPYCAGHYASEDYNLQAINPQLAKQWHPTKNGDLTPDKVTPYSNKRVWWICDKGHEYDSAISSRTRGKRCPYCSGKKVLKRLPPLEKKMNEEK